MMKIQILLAAFCLAAIQFSACTCVKRAQAAPNSGFIPPDKALYDMIAVQDSLLFAAFNSRNLEGLKQYFSFGLEVYQDNTGMRNYQESVDAFGALFQKDYVLKRSLVPGSLEVYPIKDYGAIETGSHTFCHSENGKQDCGTFKFMHIWENQNGKWKVVKIVTYDHKL